MNDNQSEIPAANTPTEINIHLGYIRRDIQDMKKASEESFKDIKTQIKDLDNNFISEVQFKPFRESQKILIDDVRTLTEWKDTFTGKMVGFGLGISISTSIATFILTYFIKR